MSAGRRYRRAIKRSRALMFLPEISEDDSPALRDALAIRNAASTTGKCPSCGAEMRLLGQLQPGAIVRAEMLHGSWCPAGDDRLSELRRSSP